MIHTDVIIVGGGPGGAACARRLVQLGVECLVLDRAVFPRPKLCAGWLSDGVFQALGIKPTEYPLLLTIFSSSSIHFKRLHITLPIHPYAIRRLEFDDWLLRLSGAPFHQHTVQHIKATHDGYEIDGEYSCKYLVGAGGTFCPVYRELFAEQYPRDPRLLITALEEEFIHPAADRQVRMWFFQDQLPGYAWYAPKSGGYLNVGIGAAERLMRARGTTLRQHWDLYIDKLEARGLISDHQFHPTGHSYYLRSDTPPLRHENAFLVGDAAGLATRDMGEGIYPAVMSGVLAAGAIAQETTYSIRSIPLYSNGILGRYFFHQIAGD